MWRSRNFCLSAYIAMALPPPKRRRVEDGIRGKISRPNKRLRKQPEYHSSSDEGSEQAFAPIEFEVTDDENEDEITNPSETADGIVPSGTGRSNDSDEDGSSRDEQSDREDSTSERKKRKATSKRNDPDAFSTSISKILSTKLSQGARRDPVLSRSLEAAKVSSGLAHEKSERRAKAKIKADRKEDLERDRVKDVLGLQSGGQALSQKKKNGCERLRREEWSSCSTRFARLKSKAKRPLEKQERKVQLGTPTGRKRSTR